MELSCGVKGLSDGGLHSGFVAAVAVVGGRAVKMQAYVAVKVIAAYGRAAVGHAIDGGSEGAAVESDQHRAGIPGPATAVYGAQGFGVLSGYGLYIGVVAIGEVSYVKSAAGADIIYMYAGAGWHYLSHIAPGQFFYIAVSLGGAGCGFGLCCVVDGADEFGGNKARHIVDADGGEAVWVKICYDNHGAARQQGYTIVTGGGAAAQVKVGCGDEFCYNRGFFIGFGCFCRICCLAVKCRSHKHCQGQYGSFCYVTKVPFAFGACHEIPLP